MHYKFCLNKWINKRINDQGSCLTLLLNLPHNVLYKFTYWNTGISFNMYQSKAACAQGKTFLSSWCFWVDGWNMIKSPCFGILLIINIWSTVAHLWRKGKKQMTSDDPGDPSGKAVLTRWVWRIWTVSRGHKIESIMAKKLMVSLDIKIPQIAKWRN